MFLIIFKKGKFFFYLINLFQRIAPITNIYHYYPKRKGLFSGIILCGIGVGTLVSSFIAQTVINPDNEPAKALNENEQYFDEDIAMRFPYGLKILTIYTLGITILSTLLIFPHNKAEAERHYEIEFSESKNINKFLNM